MGVLRGHTEALDRFADVSLFGVASNGEFEDVASLFPRALVYPRGFPGRWFRGKGLSKGLREAADGMDVLHAHMLWDHAVYATWRAAQKAKKPLIITPHGSLAAGWRHSSMHKQIYRLLVADRILRETSFLHVLNAAEEKACREYGVSCPIRVIPNGLPVRDFERERSPVSAWERWPVLRGRRSMLYLGRLWGEKGLDILPEAWADFMHCTRRREWILLIAGPDYRNYKEGLSRRIRSLKLDEYILMVGSVSGEVKDALFAAAEVFVLPSHGEGFSVALLEAMAAGLPVLHTRECNFPELAAFGGGWEIPCRRDELSHMLATVTNMNSEELRAVGRKGWLLGRERFTLEHLARELVAMYMEAIRK